MSENLQPSEMANVRSHFAHLCQLALADAFVTKDELTYLTKLYTNYGLSEEEFNSIMDDAFSIPFAAPEKTILRLEQLYELVRMVLIDESIDERKVKLCVEVAQKLGFQAHIVGDLIKALVNVEEETGVDKLEMDDLKIILKDSKE
jgi:hypothetical protein